MNEKNSKANLLGEEGGLDGGTFDQNPDFLGKRMSKVNYNATHNVGMQPGYLEKMEALKEEREQLEKKEM